MSSAVKTSAVAGRLPIVLPLASRFRPALSLFPFLAAALSAQQPSPPPPSPSEILTLDRISVVGRGETRATSAVPHPDVALVPGAAEPVLLLKRLPGLIIHTNDTLGLYEWGLTVRMRGFDLTQIAFDIDGVPMGRNDNRGNRVSRFIDNENLLGVTVSQGSGDVSTPAYSALGGAVHYTTASPDPTAGARLTQTFGSDSLTRTFLRADTGTLAHAAAAYASVSTTRTDHTWSPGNIEREHAEFKLQAPLGAAALTFAYRYNDRFDNDTFSLSHDEFYEFGRSHPVLVEGFTGDPDADTVNYILWTNGRLDHLVHGAIDFARTPDRRLKLVPYYQKQRGTGTGWEPHGGGFDLDPVSPAGPRRLAARHALHEMQRGGLTARGEWKLNAHALAAGLWLERETYDQFRAGYDVTPAHEIDFSRRLFTVNDWHFLNHVTQLYVEDRLTFLEERLTLSAGAKGLLVRRRFHGIPNTDAFLAGQTFRRASTFTDWFQPQAGATFNLTRAHQLFVNYAQNFSVPTLEYHANLNYDPHLRPERSENLDLGLRYSHGPVDASLTGYLIRYNDRILAILDPEDRFSVPEPLLQNVGSVHTSGAEAALAWRPAPGWRLGSALAYTDSRFRQDYFDGPTLIRVRDRVTPDTPRWQAQASLDYAARSGFFAGWDTLYLSQRFGTPLNNQALAGYAVSSARLGYAHTTRLGPFRELRLQLNLDNVFDRSYLGQVDTPGVLESYYYPGAPRAWTALLTLVF